MAVKGTGKQQLLHLHQVPCHTHHSLPCRATSVLLALSWDREVWLYNVPIPSPTTSTQDGAGGSPATPAASQCLQLAQWEEGTHVVGLHWLDGPALAVLSDAGDGTLMCLYDPGGWSAPDLIAICESVNRVTNMQPQLNKERSPSKDTMLRLLSRQQGPSV